MAQHTRATAQADFQRSTDGTGKSCAVFFCEKIVFSIKFGFLHGHFLQFRSFSQNVEIIGVRKEARLSPLCRRLKNPEFVQSFNRLCGRVVGKPERIGGFAIEESGSIVSSIKKERQQFPPPPLANLAHLAMWRLLQPTNKD